MQKNVAPSYDKEDYLHIYLLLLLSHNTALHAVIIVMTLMQVFFHSDRFRMITCMQNLKAL